MHNKRYSDEDKKTLQKKSPRAEFWGGTAEAINGYLDSVGKHGLPSVGVSKWFPIPKEISPNNIVLHLFNNSNKRLNRQKDGAYIKLLSADPSVIARAEADFGMLAQDLTNDVAAYHANLN